MGEGEETGSRHIGSICLFNQGRSSYPSIAHALHPQSSPADRGAGLPWGRQAHMCCSQNSAEWDVATWQRFTDGRASVKLLWHITSPAASPGCGTIMDMFQTLHIHENLILVALIIIPETLN